MMEAMEALVLASGQVGQELLINNEYLATGNKILKSKLKKPMSFNDSKRILLAKIGKRMGIKVLKETSCIVKPETILNCFYFFPHELTLIIYPYSIACFSIDLST